MSLGTGIGAGFLMVFLTFLPFTLWEVTGWLSPIAEALIAFLFMGIDNIGDLLRSCLSAEGTSYRRWARSLTHSRAVHMLVPKAIRLSAEDK